MVTMFSSLRLPFLSCQALLLLVMFIPSVHSHEIRPAIAELIFSDSGERYELSIELNLEALVAEVGSDHEDTDESANASEYNRLRSLTPIEMAQEFRKFESTLLSKLTLRSNGIDLSRQIKETIIPPVGDIDLPRDSVVTVTGDLFPGSTDLIFGWDTSLGSIVIRTAVDDNGDGYSAFLQNGDLTEPISITGAQSQSGWSVFLNYIAVGFEHIVPLGMDHILFVIGLFLLSTRLKPLLVQITSFTLAHTITLALGLFGVLVVPASLVEPLIAISIVYVAVENILFSRMTKWRPVLVFAFGLLHGLGFAGVLSEFGLPQGQYVVGLLGFNLGVEFGQLAIIAVCFTLVGYWFGQKAWYRKAIAIPGSLAIAAVGAYWAIERIFL